MQYNLESLDWREFEQLIGHYLKNVVGEGISLFDGSKDGGRDATFLGTANSFPSRLSPYSGQWIFQIKHRTMRNRSIDKVEKELLSTLKGELNKIFLKHNFTCDNYIYIINVDCSNTFKDESKAAFYEFCEENSLKNKLFHVVEYKDIEVYLNNNPTIRRHFPSLLKFADLEALFLRKEDLKTRGNLNYARQNIDKFVSTKHYQEVVTKINENNLLLLVGNPKSGKTSIIDATAISFLEDGTYRPYYIKNTDEFFTISSQLEEQERILFICDDIFGIHELDEAKLADWTDYFRSILGIIELKHKFLFTTRLYIYKEFERRSGLKALLPDESDPTRYVIKLNEYSIMEREQILDKHLALSDLEHEVKYIIENHKDQILSCKDFSPEVIRSLIEITSKTPITKLDQAIRKHVANPNQYLYDFFENINQEKRLILLAIATSPSTDEKEVEITFTNLSREKNFNPSVTFKTFINEIEHSIVKSKTYLSSYEIEYYHPSMYDVMIGIFKRNRDYRELMLNFFNLELFSLLTLKSVDDGSNKITIQPDEVEYLIKGLNRFITRTHRLQDVIKVIQYINYLNNETISDFRFLSPLNQLKSQIRLQISSSAFYHQYSNSNVEHWIELFSKWNLISGEAKFEYFVDLSQSFQNFNQYDFWRLVFLLESVRPGFIQDTVQPITVEDLKEKLQRIVINLRSDLDKKVDGKPKTPEYWLPLFWEIEDLINKMKKSAFGKRFIDNFLIADWEKIMKLSDFAKNRHKGMMNSGYWRKSYKRLRNFEDLRMGRG